MTYTYVNIETIEVTKTVKPSEMYTSPLAFSNIQEKLADYKIVAFRPPRTGEKYLWTPSGDIIDTAPGMYGVSKNSQCRFILEKRENRELQGWWE